jgi:uncharacterized protein YggE
MKSLPSFYLLVFGSIFLAVNPLTATPDNTRIIVVEGQAEVRLVPDFAVFRLSIDSTRDDLKEAKAYNDVRVARMVEEIKKSGVKSADIKRGIAYVHVLSKGTSSVKSGKEPIKAYRVSTVLEVTLRDVANFEKFHSRLIELGVDRMQDVELSSTRLEAAREEALLKSLTVARKKAEKMANVFAMQVALPYKIEEIKPRQEKPMILSPGADREMMKLSRNKEDKVAHEIEVAARVRIEFELK